MRRILIEHPATSAAGSMLIVLTAFFWATGALFPQELPVYAESSRQITGMALMLILMPAYFVASGPIARRRSLELVEQLRSQLPDRSYAYAATKAIRGGLRSSWAAGTAAGLLMGLLNTNPIHALTQSAVPLLDISISLGQMVLWLTCGLLLGTRVVSARAFSRLGEVVDFDLFRMDRLRPIARSGVIDVVVIAGALALTPLQSLDAAFRWYNYRFGLIVAIPAAVLLVLWPLRRLHRRIRDEKERQLGRIEAITNELPADATAEDLLRFETLLAHRDRVRDQPTWPLSTALVSRIFLYLIIPPLAWVGAALVEMVVSRIVAG